MEEEFLFFLLFRGNVFVNIFNCNNILIEESILDRCCYFFWLYRNEVERLKGCDLFDLLFLNVFWNIILIYK